MKTKILVISAILSILFTSCVKEEIFERPVANFICETNLPFIVMCYGSFSTVSNPLLEPIEYRWGHREEFGELTCLLELGKVPYSAEEDTTAFFLSSGNHYITLEIRENPFVRGHSSNTTQKIFLDEKGYMVPDSTRILRRQ